MLFDDLLLFVNIQAAFLTAALLPYSSDYILENDCNGFVDTACKLFLDISTHLKQLEQR